MPTQPVHKQTHRTTRKHVEHLDATDIQKKNTLFLCFRIFIFRQTGQIGPLKLYLRKEFITTISKL